MVDPNTNGDEPRLELTGGGSGARVVLAEVDAPGSLHYLLEAEGFQVVGCAGDEEELARVLGQDVRPDVVVLDADVIATASVVARELAPDAHVIAIWPDDVQPPPGGERVSPRAVYEDLGPAIRRHMDRRSVPVPVIALPDEAVGAAAMASVAVGARGAASARGLATAGGSASGGVFARAASRMSVLSVTLITAILFTMGVSFALGGFRSSPPIGPPRIDVPGSAAEGGVSGTADPLTGRVPAGTRNGQSGNGPSTHGNGPGTHHGASGFLGGVVTTGTGDGGGAPTDQTGGQGDQTGGQSQGDQGQGDQGGQSGQGGQGGQGNQGGGQGDQGGGQGNQGGGPGDHGGGPGDHGGGSGQHGGGGQGDQGGDGQGEDDQGGQGDQDGDDQNENDQGGPGSHGNQGPHGDGHGAHSDQSHGQNDQGSQS